MTYTNSITSKGQVTIPKEFRDKLGLETSGKAEFSLNNRGEVVISRPPTVEELRAFIAKPGKQDNQLSAYDRKRGEELARKYGVR